MAMHVYRLAIAFLFVLGSLSTAQAGPNKKSKKQANALVRKAQKAQGKGKRLLKKKQKQAAAMKQYKRAARLYLNALALDEKPTSVHALSEVYLVRGELSWALRGFTYYLQIAPDGKQSQHATEAIEELTQRIASGDDSPGESEIDPTEIFGEAPIVEDIPEEVVEEAAPPPKPAIVKTPVLLPKKRTTKKTGAGLRYAGIGTAVLGVAVLGLGVKYGLDASSAENDLSAKQGPWTAADIDRIDDGERANRNMILFSAIGAAGIVGGGVLYYLGAGTGHAKETHSRITPLLSPTRATISWTGNF